MLSVTTTVGAGAGEECSGGGDEDRMEKRKLEVSRPSQVAKNKMG
jgi:hypothetical protein